MQNRPAIVNRITERTSVTRSIFEMDIAAAGLPVVMKGLLRDWPVVKAALESREALAAYLKAGDGGKKVETLIGDPKMQGRYFYNDDMTGFNFKRAEAPFSALIDQLLKMADASPQMMLYVGSTSSRDTMPGFASDNPIPLLDAAIEPRLWLGNTSRVAAHFDVSRNIAVCVSGTRRFTIFPPDQIGNLYLGPLEFTMAGPPASMIDFHAPDYDRYPKFRDAEKSGMVADLEPGDAIYIPSLWWHHVEVEGPFNLLVNYWWHPDQWASAFESMMLALMDLRDQPRPEKEAWRSYFEHFVFGDDAASVGKHLPEKWQRLTGPKNRGRDDQILNFILGQLKGRQSAP
jgi:Cupin-like domain